MYHDNYFYVLANKKEKRLGYFLLRIDATNPDKEPEYYMRWHNKLDIGNCDL